MTVLYQRTTTMSLQFSKIFAGCQSSSTLFTNDCCSPLRLQVTRLSCSADLIRCPTVLTLNLHNEWKSGPAINVICKNNFQNYTTHVGQSSGFRGQRGSSLQWHCVHNRSDRSRLPRGWLLSSVCHLRLIIGMRWVLVPVPWSCRHNVHPDLLFMWVKV